ncbi:Chemotaxis response regulator protein-glutamate methylesterase CheB [hydrothermal vent metagenome]|uniref:protein-glutamate methylesterase n=1 Tax=hydrothermal vent metagenome TaxID=652676 RepID=A0A3B1D6Z3_9ZZZZ
MSIKTLIVDDMVLYRKMLSDVLAEHGDVEVIGVAANGSIALRKMEQSRVDLVFMDMYMPEMNGLETLKHIRQRFPETKVIMISGVASREGDVILEALANGALDFIQKPSGKVFQENLSLMKSELGRVLGLVRANSGAAIKPEKQATPAQVKEDSPKPVARFKGAVTPTSFSVVVIGVSTGGPAALTKIIPNLPKNFPAPILMVQHMPPVFTKSLALSLDKKSGLTVKEAEEGEAIVKGKVLIAPGGKHLVASRSSEGAVVKLGNGPAEHSCKPAVDVLFRSVAESYGNEGVMALVLTGMGSDGASGVEALKQKGCYCITQSEQTCVIYGMPRAVDEAGLSDANIDLEKIPAFIMGKLL